MNKKTILSTLLISSALLGTISASAATSAVRPEKKLVSVEKSNAKIYKNSKLQESKKAKKGTVYKVDGYRNINSKKYYRVYQQDTKGKNTYKGYILAKDVQDLKAGSVDKKDRFVGLTEADQTAWKNLYFNRKIKTYDGTKHSSNFEVKRTYDINGKKYFSLYRGEQWMGYMDGSAFKVLTPKAIEEDKQAYKVVKAWNIYNDIYFTKKDELTKGEEVTVKRVYTFGTGRQYGSLYNKEGKWIGYANMRALEEVETSTPEEPDTPVKPDKPGTGGDTSKPDTKPDNPGDKPTDKPDGDKPGQGGDNKPGGDQSGSESGDAENKPGAGDSGSESQPNNPGTEISKPTDAEVKALQDAIAKAKKVIAAKDQLNGVTEVENALKKAEEILKKQIEGKATKAEVVNATKEIEAAIKGITLKPSVNKESIEKLHTAIEQLKETQKLGAGNLVNNEKYDEVLKEAQKVLEDAVNGKANKEKIDAETKKVNDFINKLQLNTKYLEDKINAVKEKGDKVYMTKDQEKSFNDFIEAAKKAAEDTKLSNTNKLKEIDENLKKVEDFIKGQPTEADVQKLIDATKKEQEVVDQLKGKEEQIFENWNTVAEKADAADKMLENIKKDTASKNDATEKYTAEQVKTTAKELMDSMANLEVNHDNLKKYHQVAKEAIEQLDPGHKEVAEKLLKSFEVAAENASVKYLSQMVNAANKLNKEIHDDQIQEINDVIKKAQRIEGPSQENKKFYESSSYNQMDIALEAAEKAERDLVGEESVSHAKRLVNAGATQVVNGKLAAEKEKDLKEKINELQIKDWTVKEEKDGVIQLTKYKGDYTSTDSQQKNGNSLIEIPGSLKDKQVVVESTKGNQLFNSERLGDGSVEIKFELSTDNKKPKTGSDFSFAFAYNNKIGKVDIENLDTIEATDLTGLFTNDFQLKEIKGSDKLVHKKVTSLKGAFAGTNITVLDTTNWDTTNVTNMFAMFRRSKVQIVKGMENWDTANVTDVRYMFGGSQIQKLNLSGWAMDKILNEDLDSIFFDDRYTTLEKTDMKTNISEVILPDQFKGKPTIVVKALESAGKKSQLAKDVAVYSALNKKLGKVTKNGIWQQEDVTQRGETIVSDEATLKDAPKLARAITSSPKASEDAKKLARIVDAGYKVDKNSTGDKAKSIAKLDNNLAWHEFGANGKGSYYDSLKDLQDYARNTASVKDEELQKDAKELSKDMDDLRVLTDYLDEAMKEAEKVENSAKESHVEGSEVETTEQLIEKAKVIIADEDKTQRELEDWNTINKLTAKLKEAAKKLTTLVKK